MPLRIQTDHFIDLQFLHLKDQLMVFCIRALILVSWPVAQFVGLEHSHQGSKIETCRSRRNVIQINYILKTYLKQYVIKLHATTVKVLG